MENLQEIKRFTQNFNALANPPWLPVAAWFAVVPMAMNLGYLPPVLGFTLLPLAVGASLLLTRWFKRRYGVVVPQDPKPWIQRKSLFLILIPVIIAAEWVTYILELPIELGPILFGIVWTALALRSRLFHWLVPSCAIIVAGLYPPLLQGATFFTLWGIAWGVVCLWDYCVLSRHLSRG
jgi:hypothetical protein